MSSSRACGVRGSRSRDRRSTSALHLYAQNHKPSEVRPIKLQSVAPGRPYTDKAGRLKPLSRRTSCAKPQVRIQPPSAIEPDYFLPV
jgi:hypothetical protein